MKKIYFLFCLMLCSIISYAQIQNLSELSTGVLETSTKIYDKEQNVIGYVFIYNKGLTNQDKDVQYEYVLLDDNLNKLTNGDYTSAKHKKISYKLTDIEFKDQKLYLTSIIYHTKKLLTYGYNLKIIDLKANKVIADKFYKEYTFSEMSEITNFELLVPLHERTNNRLMTFTNNSKVYFIDQLTIYTGLSAFAKGITVFNEDFSKTLDYNINKENQKEAFSFNILSVKDDKLLIFLKNPKGTEVFKKIGADYFKAFDLEKSQEISKAVYNSFNTNGNEYFLPNTEFIKDNLTVVGEIKLMTEGSIYKIEDKPTVGILRTVYDALGKELVNRKIYFSEVFKELGFINGRDKNGYKFLLKEFFNYNDQSFSILLQKQKGNNVAIAPRTTDYILVNFDNRGILKNYQVLEKTKLKHFDSYLFSQENKEENEVLFFYAEEKKEEGKKEWYLIINKLKNGELTQERMPFKTDSSNLRFSKAKYGYIFISEYNKEDKESSIRLEKLNIL
ncbi:hypothetical protein SAMN05443634_105305 [Chishuiella changwenlii]|uniref:Uncharacterized protein n=2 Tax=Chishuiella changwenlii TaxID=1434701 RepID=A0A1M6XMM2_9FLAO|nr:DUF6770 family protein [Chishuiella changwenlii]SHL07158.1 hypothetical protein SAMN05443634_105305 [Chishuiella changwenlii]